MYLIKSQNFVKNPIFNKAIMALRAKLYKVINRHFNVRYTPYPQGYPHFCTFVHVLLVSCETISSIECFAINVFPMQVEYAILALLRCWFSGRTRPCQG